MRCAGFVASGSLRLVGVVLAAFAVGGCGYRLATGSGLERAAAGRAVEVEVFANRSAEADAGFIAARAAQRAVAPRLGSSGADGPPLRLAGTIQSASFGPVAYDGAGAVSLWRAQVRVGLVLRDPVGTSVAEASAEGAADYPSGSDPESTEVSRRLAFHRLLERLVDAGLDRLAPPK
jgi:hypothetical protein